jgi:predicted transcriptional regulator
MPDSPDKNEPPRPARKSKRARRTSTPRRSNSTTTRANLLADCPPETRQALEMLFRLTPLQFLELIIKLVLRDRVTDDEARLICNIHYSAVMHWGIWKE